MLFFLVCAEDGPCVRVSPLTWEVAQLQLLGREITIIIITTLIIIITSSPPSSSSSSSTCVSQRWPARSRNYNYLDTTTTNTDPLLRSRSRDPSSVIIYHSYCYYVICYYHKLPSNGHHHHHNHHWPFFESQILLLLLQLVHHTTIFASTADIHPNKTIHPTQKLHLTDKKEFLQLHKVTVLAVGCECCSVTNEIDAWSDSTFCPTDSWIISMLWLK